LSRAPNILIVDDHEANIYVMSHMLANIDCVLAVSTSGKIAVEKAQSQRFDLALVDVRMPDMDGFQTVQEIRAIQPLLPVIFVTAEPKDESQIKSVFPDDAIDVLFKPLDDESLLFKKIQNLLEAAEKKREFAGHLQLVGESGKLLGCLLELLSSEFNEKILFLMSEFKQLNLAIEDVSDDAAVALRLGDSVIRCSGAASQLGKTHEEIKLYTDLLKECLTENKHA